MARCFFCNYHSRNNSRFIALNTVKPYPVIICLKCIKKIAKLYNGLSLESRMKKMLSNFSIGKTRLTKGSLDFQNGYAKCLEDILMQIKKRTTRKD